MKEGAARSPRVRSRTGHDERGAVLIMFAAMLLMLLGFTALAVDIGMLYTTQTQMQRAVDAGALAGAGWLAEHPSPVAVPGARAEAELYTEFHEAMGDPLDIDPALDIEFESDTLVRVWAHRTAARGNPVSMFFARALGFNEGNVRVKAAAVVAPAAATEQCVFPFITPDAWREADGRRSSEIPFSNFANAPTFSPAAGDRYLPPQRLCGSPGGNCWDAYTGWGARAADQGRYFIARWGNTGSNTPSAGWWYTLSMPPDGHQGGGASNVAAAIRGICEETATVSQGSRLFIQTGFAQGPISRALDDVLQGAPADSAAAVACYRGQSSVCGSPVGGRLRTMMFYNPANPPGPGSSVPTVVGNFAKVWLAGWCSPGYPTHPLCSGLSTQDKRNTFLVMYLGPTSGGVAAQNPGGASPGLTALRLVE